MIESERHFSRRRGVPASPIAAVGFGGMGTAAADPGERSETGKLSDERAP